MVQEADQLLAHPNDQTLNPARPRTALRIGGALLTIAILAFPAASANPGGLPPIDACFVGANYPVPGRPVECACFTVEGENGEGDGDLEVPVGYQECLNGGDATPGGGSGSAMAHCDALGFACSAALALAVSGCAEAHASIEMFPDADIKACATVTTAVSAGVVRSLVPPATSPGVTYMTIVMCHAVPDRPQGCQPDSKFRGEAGWADGSQKLATKTYAISESLIWSSSECVRVLANDDTYSGVSGTGAQALGRTAACTQSFVGGTNGSTNRLQELDESLRDALTENLTGALVRQYEASVVRIPEGADEAWAALDGAIRAQITASVQGTDGWVQIEARAPQGGGASE